MLNANSGSAFAAPAEVATPGPSLTIDAAANQHAISPNIYGLNFAKETFASEISLPLRRWGGNATSRYNWQNGNTNAAMDWYYENMPQSNDYTGASETHTQWVDQNVRTSTQSLITIPLLGYVAKDSTSCGFSIAKYGTQQDKDVWRTDCGNGVKTNGSNLTGNTPTDTSVVSNPASMQNWVASLVTRYGSASAGGVKFYAMDNEPDLWGDTHRDVHPAMQSYDELYSKIVSYASAVKTADPSAQVLGYSSFGWTGYWYSELDSDTAAKNGYTYFPDYQTHGNLYQVPWLLTQMHTHDSASGTRLLDYLDLHYYPASGNDLTTAGDANMQALRLRSTRSLWDPTYTDESWIGGSDQPADWRNVRLIPRMHAWVNTYYPGTKLAITEYNFGGLESINGALTQADVLGIFGREGLDMASLWNYPNSSDGLGYDNFETEPGAYAFRMYRNYDGSGSKFGDISLSASSADQSKLAVYGSRRTSDGALTLMIINKTSNILTSSVGLSNFQPGASAQVFNYSSANLTAIVRKSDQAVTASGFTADFPPNSITLVVIPLASVPNLGGCAMFPADNIWNAKVDSLPVNTRSDQWLTSIGKATGFHMDFGSGSWDGGPIGIPYNVVTAGIPKYTVSFYYPDQSDPGPYPIGASPNIEYGSDHHLLTVDSSTCTLYEMYDVSVSGGTWSGGSGAIWNLASNALRPDGWTSADAAGLPILPGLVRYDEILSGHINHAIRFTASSTNGYIWPARHLTSNDSNAPQIPPMGARFRLKSSYNISSFSTVNQIILQAMKTYGIILADNGSNWYISGVPDLGWNDSDLHLLGALKGSDFEAVDSTSLIMDPNSGAAWTPSYTISGSAGVPGATLSYTDGQARSTTADSSGNYSLGVSKNWSGTVSIGLTGYTFTPNSKTYSNVSANQTGQNYSAAANGAPPTIVSIIRASTNPSAATTVNFNVTFSKSVTGVDKTDFSITQVGLTGTSVSSVSGSGAAYTVATNTGTGNYGTLRLDVVDDDSIKDLSAIPLGGTGTGNGNFNSGETYTISKPANINVSAAGGLQGNYNVPALSTLRQTYNGLNNGPLQITSSGYVVLSSIQVNYGGVSYSEMLGLPTSLLSKEYWFPVYDSTGSLASQLRVGNLGSAGTTITVYIGNGVQLDQFTLAGNTAIRKNYSTTNNGPLRVVSSATNIMTSVRYLYGNSSYSEELGMPVGSLTNDYWFPWYNNTAFSSELRVANAGSSTANVSIYLGNGTLLDSFALTAGQNSRKTYASANNGPLHVVSTGANILPSIKILYGSQSYSEMLGMPASRLTNEYWMPYYDNSSLSSQIRVGNLGSASTTISVYTSNNVLLDSYTLGIGAATRKTYTGAANGPLHIISSTTNVMVSNRELYTTSGFESYYELLAYPGNQLTTEYWFPWYNNSAFQSELRIGVP